MVRLGLEAMDRSLMNGKPVPRGESIVTLKMFLGILIHGGYIAAVFLLQLSFDFLRIPAGESAAAVDLLLGVVAAVKVVTPMSHE